MDETRCSGHCCKEFMLPWHPAEGAARAFGWALAGAFGLVSELDANWNVWEMGTIAGMVRPARIVSKGERLANGEIYEWHEPEQLWTCSRFDGANCTDYENRPDMCSRYPYNRACAFEGCTWETGRLGLHPPMAPLLIEAADSKDLVRLPVIQ